MIWQIKAVLFVYLRKNMYLCRINQRLNRQMDIKTARNEELFKELFEENYSRLFYVALLIVNDEADAHDIVEDYLIELWEDFDPKLVYTQNYLTNGVRRRCLDFIRHEHVKNRYAQLYLALHEEAHDHFEEEDLEERMSIIEREY